MHVIEPSKASPSSTSLETQDPTEGADIKMSVVRSWLPPPEVQHALSEEPRRFKAIFRALKADLDTSTGHERSHRSLEWLSLVQRWADAPPCLLPDVEGQGTGDSVSL